MCARAMYIANTMIGGMQIGGKERWWATFGGPRTALGGPRVAFGAVGEKTMGVNEQTCPSTCPWLLRCVCTRDVPWGYIDEGAICAMETG